MESYICMQNYHFWRLASLREIMIVRIFRHAWSLLKIRTGMAPAVTYELLQYACPSKRWRRALLRITYMKAVVEDLVT